MSVLIVNMNSLETSAFEQYMAEKMNNSRVVSAGCGERAWEYLIDWQGNEFNSKSNGLDAIVLEVRLCCLDGVSLVQRIRQHQTVKHIPVIVWYSYLPALESKTFDSLGVTAKIFKGFDSDSRHQCYQRIEKYIRPTQANESYGLAL